MAERALKHHEVIAAMAVDGTGKGLAQAVRAQAAIIFNVRLGDEQPRGGTARHGAGLPCPAVAADEKRQIGCQFVAQSHPMQMTLQRPL